MIPDPVPTLENLFAATHGRRMSGKGIEYQFAALRCGALAALLLYLIVVSVSARNSPVWRPDQLLPAGLFLLAATGLLAHMTRHPGPQRYRIAIGALLDVGGACYLALWLNAWALPLYFLALCIVLHYGFRHGISLLLLALAAFAVGFGANLLPDPFRAGQRTIATMLLASMVLTALFVGVHIARLGRRQIKLQRTIDAQADFLSLLSDELCVPLEAIRRSVEPGAGSPRSRDRPPHDVVDIASHYLLPLSDDIRDYCAIQENGLTVASDAFNLYECVQGALVAFRLQAPHCEQRVSLQIDAALPFVVHGDEARLRRALTHLLRGTVCGLGAGDFLIRLSSENGVVGQATLQLSILRARLKSRLARRRPTRPQARVASVDLNPDWPRGWRGN